VTAELLVVKSSTAFLCTSHSMEPKQVCQLMRHISFSQSVVVETADESVASQLTTTTDEEQLNVEWNTQMSINCG